jgi:hypothetical protein
VKIGLPTEAGKLFSFELELKVSSPEGDDEVRASRESQAEAGDTMRSRRKRTLLSFQRPVPRPGGGVKKPPTRARGLQAAMLIVSDRGL